MIYSCLAEEIGGMRLIKSLGLLLFVVYPLAVFAEGYNVSGKIIKPDGTAFSSATVSFILTVSSPDDSCVIYREQIDGVNMSQSNGGFNIVLGSGTKLYPANPATKLDSLVSNKAALSCNGGATYTPAIGDERNLKISFYDGTEWVEFSSQKLKAVPFATESKNAEVAAKLDTYSSTNFLRVDGASLPALTNAQATALYNLGDGSSTTYLKTSTMPTCAAGEFASWNGTNFICSSPTSSLPAGTAGQFLKYNGGAWQSSALAIADIPGLSIQLADKIDKSTLMTCSSDQALNYSSVTDTFFCTNVSLTLNGDVTGSNTATSVTKIRGVAVAAAAPTPNQVLAYDGAQWTPTNIATGGVTSITAGAGLTGGTINTSGTIALGTTGVSAGTYGNGGAIPSITLDIYGRVTSVSTTSITYPVTTVNSKSGTVILDYGDIASASTKYMTYKPNNTACADGQILKWNNTSARWECGTDSAGLGTVTNVSSANSYATVANSSTTPIITVNVGTTAGTVAAGNDARLSDARMPSGTATGDLSGSYPSPTVARIQGKPVDVTAGYAEGDSLVYDATNAKWKLKKVGCEAGYTRVNKGHNFCIKSYDATTRNYAQNVIACGDIGADVCSTNQLINACRDANKIPLNVAVWSDTLFNDYGVAIQCTSAGGAYTAITDYSTNLARTYCCKPLND